MGVVARIERVTVDQIDSIGGHELLQYRGTSLPLISVDETLDVKPRPDYSRLYVIVFTIGNREVGLIAPQLDDIREVSSEIDSETFRTAGVAGSLFVDDRLIRILDVFQLAENRIRNGLPKHARRSRTRMQRLASCSLRTRRSSVARSPDSSKPRVSKSKNSKTELPPGTR